uniref:Uncharacterized protein n=1 Tax=CrAss-like virus sp. ctYsL76 TaxID=2826826 RepID=A0A8S5QLE3_9CAUD|nr:MAG TPA: hypothetical protein [CrAss-like virus sp. ctYsL76]
MQQYLFSNIRTFQNNEKTYIAPLKILEILLLNHLQLF